MTIAMVTPPVLSLFVPFVVAMAAPGDGTSSLIQLIPFALVIAIFYFIILLPMKRRQKKVDEFLGGLKTGDKVVTTGGMYGTIIRLNEKSVKLQIAEKVTIEISKAAMAGYQGQEPVVTEAASQQAL